MNSDNNNNKESSGLISDSEATKHFNRIMLNDESRIMFIKEYVERIGILLAIPSVMWEQILAAAESDFKTLEKAKQEPSPIIQQLAKLAMDIAKQENIVLKAFIKHRPAILATMQELGAERMGMFE